MYRLILIFNLCIISFLFPQEKSNILFEQANQKLVKHQLDEAIDSFNLLLKKNKNSSIYYNLSVAYLEKYKKTKDEKNFVYAYKNIVIAYFMKPFDSSISSQLSSLETKQANSIDITKSYPPLKIMFIKYHFLFLSLLLFILSLFYFFFFKKSKLSIKFFFIIHFVMVCLIILIFYLNYSFKSSIKDIIVVKEQNKDEKNIYYLGDSFYLINENIKECAFLMNDNVYWVNKNKVFIIQVNPLLE